LDFILNQVQNLSGQNTAQGSGYNPYGFYNSPVGSNLASGFSSIYGPAGFTQGGELTPPLSGPTYTGLNALLAPYSGPGLDQLNATASGDYLNSNPYTGIANTQGLQDAIVHDVSRAVGDQFSLASRTGSPAQQDTLAREITRQLAPLEYGAQQNALNRGFQGYNQERTNQLNALLPLLGLQDTKGQQAVQAGSILDQFARSKALDPYTKLQYLTGPIASVISGAPQTTTTTTPTNNNPFVSALGAGLAGSQLGSAIFGGGSFSSNPLSYIDTSAFPSRLPLYSTSGLL
jgi:hypothetical protein